MAEPESGNSNFDDLLKYISDSDNDVTPSDVDRAYAQGQSIEEKKGEAELDRYNQDTQHRQVLVTWAAIVVSIWLLSVLLILVNNNNNYHLSDTVLGILLGTTTINVLGLMIIVLTDIFPKSYKKK